MARQTRNGNVSEQTTPGDESRQKRPVDVAVATYTSQRRKIHENVDEISKPGQSSVELAGHVATSGGSISISLKSDACRKNEQGMVLCSVNDCPVIMDKQPMYYRRYKVCKDHLRSWSLMVEGEPQRFCQQCGRFHNINQFDAKKKNCRKRLEKHNSRRRKYLMTKDGSKIRKNGDLDARSLLHSQPLGGLFDDAFPVDIPSTEYGEEHTQQGEDSGKSSDALNGKELYNSDGTLSAHPTLVSAKIAEYYGTPNRKNVFYPKFINDVTQTERFLGQRMLQSWMGKTPGDKTANTLDEDVCGAESMVYAIHQALSLQQAGILQEQQAELLGKMGLI